MHLSIEKCPHSPILSAGLSFFNLSGKPNTKRQQLLVSDWCHEEPDGSHEESIASLVVNTQCSIGVDDGHRFMHHLHDVLQFFETSLINCIVNN